MDRTLRIATRIYGTNGIRGVFNVDLDVHLALKIGMAVGSFYQGGDVFIGNDARISSPSIKAATISGLLATGCTVYDVGMAPTPVIQYAVRYFKPKGGIVITASHNPPEFNGIKTLTSDGIETSREQEHIIEEILFKENFRKISWEEAGSLKFKPDIANIYKEAVKSHVDVDLIKSKAMKVVLDLGNGVGALIYPSLLSEVGCEVICINSEIDGRFPARGPEPTPEKLTDLCNKVRDSGADLGIAYDGDGDRAIFCDERGIAYWGDKSAAILMKHVLRKTSSRKVVTPISSSKLLEDIAKECKADLIYTKVGSIDVSYKMKEVGAVYGCEENGGCFYAPHQPVRDGGMTSLLMIECLALEGRKLSSLVEELPRYYLRKAKIPCPNELKNKVERLVIERTKEYERITIDGVKLFLPEGRVLIRPSGTEPIFRIYVDAYSESGASKILDWSSELLKDIIQEVEK